MLISFISIELFMSISDLLSYFSGDVYQAEVVTRSVAIKIDLR